MNFIKDFADGVRALNQTIVSDEQIETIVGRAYLVDKSGKAYTKPVWTFPANEQATLVKRFKTSADRNMLYMGTAGLINLYYLYKTQPSAAILFDINPYQTLFLKKVIEAAIRSEDYNSFIDSFEAIENSMPCQFYNLMDAYSLRQFIKTGMYRFLKKIGQQNAIGTLTLDILDKNSCDQLAAFIKQHKSLELITLYLSNIMPHIGTAKDYRDFTGRPIAESFTAQSYYEAAVQNITNILKSVAENPDDGLILDENANVRESGHVGVYDGSSFMDFTHKDAA